jgi:hypothetical protein
MDKVFQAQLEYPDAGRFRLHGVLEQEMEEDTPSESTVGRAMAQNRFWRGAPHPLGQEDEAGEEPAELPYKPLYHHQYWFIDIRYLVRFEGKWVYSICIIEGVSRAILAGMVSRYQDELAILQLLHAAFGDYGVPWGIVSDNASVFNADAFMRVLEGLEIEPCPIESQQPWQNLIEIVFTQMTKRGLLALGTGRNDVADLDLTIDDKHAVNHQLDQLPTLREVQLVKRGLYASTEGLNSFCQHGQIQVALSLHFELTQLLPQSIAHLC